MTLPSLQNRGGAHAPNHTAVQFSHLSNLLLQVPDEVPEAPLLEDIAALGVEGRLVRLVLISEDGGLALSSTLSMSAFFFINLSLIHL